MSRRPGLAAAIALAFGAAVAHASASGAASVAYSAVAGIQTGSAPLAAEDPELEAQVRAISSRLRCPTCRALSVYDSPSEIAREMRALIREKLQAGETPVQVEAYFVERYGEWVLLEPPARGFNWSVWLLPFAVLLGGAVFVLLTVRRWVERGRALASLPERGEEEI